MARTLTKSATKNVGKEVSKRQTIAFGTSNVLTEMQFSVRGLCRNVDRMASLDITRPLKYAFDRAGMSRQTFKRLTGLEPRLFMRGDARVRVYLFRKDTLDKFKTGGEVYQK